MLLLAQTRAANTVLALRRVEVRAGTIAAMRDLEARLMSALGANGRLRGMPNLGTRKFPHYAVRITTSAIERSTMPRTGREVLVLDMSGRIEVAHFDQTLGIVDSRPVRDEELVMEDLAFFARLVAELLERHVALTERRTRELEKSERLAKRIFEAMREEDFG